MNDDLSAPQGQKTSNAKSLMEHYREVRARLRTPPNAVPDTGIDLMRGRRPEPPLEIDFSNIVPFKRRDLTFSGSLEFTATEFGITPEQIRQHSRCKLVALPRQIAIYLTAKNTKQSLMSMGRYLGMDHTTILHARSKVGKMVERSPLCAAYIMSLEERLLAAFNRANVPAISKPYLGCPTKPKDRNSGKNAIPGISPVDKTVRSTFCDAEDKTPDVGG